MKAARDDRAARLILVASALAGIGLAAVSILRSGDALPVAPAGAVAVVNGRPIPRETFARFAGAVAAERKAAELDAETRRRLLERLIEEELLLQRGIELGLHRLEPTARKSVVTALIASVTSEAEAVEPSEAELRTFLAAHSERFTRPGRLQVDAALVSVGERPDAVAYRRAEEIARRLRAGEPFDAVRAELADEPVVALPGGPLPVETLRQYLGPTPAYTASRLEPGQVSDPARGSAGYYVLVLRERAAPEPPRFEEVRAQVRAEYLRSLGEEALREYLAELRDASDIRILDGDLEGEAAEP